MLARINLEPKSLYSASAPEWLVARLHDQLVQQLRAHGVLVFSGDAEVGSLVREIKGDRALSPRARKVWVEALVELRKSHRIRVLDGGGNAVEEGPLSLDGLRVKYGGQIDLAVVGEEAWRNLGFPVEPGFSRVPESGFQIAHLFSASSSPTMTKIQEQEARAFAPFGALREDFWERVLRPMVDGARTVSIIDGYLFKTLWRRAAGAGPADGDSPEHVVWLLRKLDEVMAVGAEVRLISRWDSRPRSVDLDPDGTAKLVRRVWAPRERGSLHRVSLYLPSSAKRGLAFPHDRHIRSNYGVGLLIPPGFDRLEHRTITSPEGMNWQFKWEPVAIRSLRKAEDLVTESVGPPSATILKR